MTPNDRARKTTTAPAAAPKTNPADLAKALKDAAHVVVGFGVIGWNKAQVRRRELVKEFSGQGHQVEARLDAAKEQLASVIRTLDTRLQPVRQDLDSRLDKVTERLPGKAREVLESARTIARDTEHQVRQAVGAL